MVKKLVPSILLIATISLAGQPASAGGPEKIPVDISIRVDPNPRAVQERGKVFYVGKLRSEKRACENLREVTLWRITEGTDEKQNQGTNITNGAGKWAIVSYTNPDGEYFATTPKITLPGSGKVCKRGRSKSIIRDVMP